jgi:hypothetical protein
MKQALKNKIETALKKANKAEQELNSRCGVLAALLQPQFEEEITVLYQSGDGFVVCYEEDHRSAPANIPIIEFIQD